MECSLPATAGICHDSPEKTKIKTPRGRRPTPTCRPANPFRKTLALYVGFFFSGEIVTHEKQAFLSCREAAAPVERRAWWESRKGRREKKLRRETADATLLRDVEMQNHRGETPIRLRRNSLHL